MAIVGSLILQVPPLTVLVNVDVLPGQIVVVPDIADGVGLTVIDKVVDSMPQLVIIL